MELSKQITLWYEYFSTRINLLIFFIEALHDTEAQSARWANETDLKIHPIVF